MALALNTADVPAWNPPPYLDGNEALNLEHQDCIDGLRPKQL